MHLETYDCFVFHFLSELGFLVRTDVLDRRRLQRKVISLPQSFANELHPNGRASLENPQGTEIPGSPARLVL